MQVSEPLRGPLVVVSSDVVRFIRERLSEARQLALKLRHFFSPDWGLAWRPLLVFSAAVFLGDDRHDQRVDTARDRIGHAWHAKMNAVAPATHSAADLRGPERLQFGQRDDAGDATRLLSDGLQHGPFALASQVFGLVQAPRILPTRPKQFVEVGFVIFAALRVVQVVALLLKVRLNGAVSCKRRRETRVMFVVSQ